MIIFTDLDGTLLDHSGYSWRDALPALKEIRSKNVPLVMCTSKTRKEVEVLQEEMGLREPFIVENGAGIYFPEDYRGFRIEKSVARQGLHCLALGASYSRIRSFVEKVRAEYPIRGFGDMSVEEVAERTGLAPEEAARAKAREFTEPFIIEGERVLHNLQKDAQRAGIRITRGGRFFCFTGKGHDKGKAVKKTRDIFEKNQACRYLSIGLGDSCNDLPMLSQVDIPVLIPHPDGSIEDFTLPNLVCASLPGSIGWNRAVSALLSSLDDEAFKRTPLPSRAGRSR